MKAFMKYKSFSTLLFILITLFLVQFTPVSATAVSESELINILKESPNTLILDIRWDEVYQNGHLPGAILIDSSLPESKQHSEADSIIAQKGISKTDPIAMLCNCGDGHFARLMEEYLIGQGYNNTYHLKTSFSLWTHKEMLVGGPNPNGYSITGNPDLGGVTGSNPLGDIGFFVLLIGAAGIGGFFVYNAMQKPMTSEQINKSLKKTEKKKVQELSTLKKIVTEKTSTSTSTKSGKQKRRRRH